MKTAKDKVLELGIDHDFNLLSRIIWFYQPGQRPIKFSMELLNMLTVEQLKELVNKDRQK